MKNGANAPFFMEPDIVLRYIVQHIIPCTKPTSRYGSRSGASQQKDALEEASGVTVEGQDLVSQKQGHAYSGHVKIELEEAPPVYLDLYDRDRGYEISAHQSGTDWTERYNRSTVPDLIFKVTRLVGELTGETVYLDRDHWPPCRVVFMKTHPTARRERRTCKVLHRGSFLECWEYLQDSLDDEPIPSDYHFDIEGDLPRKHTVEQPPVETKSDELPF